MNVNLVSVFGERFLRYVLALPDDVSLGESLSLSGSQMEVVEMLQSFLAQLPRENDAGFGAFNSLTQFTSMPPANLVPADRNHCVANLLRIHAGGEVESPPESADVVSSHLLALAVEAYPGYLLPVPKQGSPMFWRSVSLVSFQHPIGVQFVCEILRDESLVKLFPESPDPDSILSLGQASQVQALWYLSSGRGGTVQAISLAGFLLGDGYSRIAMSAEEISLASYLSQVVSALEDARRLARGETVMIGRLVGLFNVQLVDGVSIRVGSGVIRQPLPLELERIFPHDVTVQSLFETQYPLRLLDVTTWRTGEQIFPRRLEQLSPVIEDYRRASQKEIDDARLALLLGSDSGALIGASESASVMLDPLSPGGVVSYRRDLVSPIGTVTVTGEIAGRVASWVDIIRSQSAPKLEIGIRRLLSTVATRQDPADGFVDAVICWENLFGTRSETTFRVTGALAWLVEPDDLERRTTLQGELKKLYDRRSNLVHGSDEPSAANAVEMRNRSAELAVEALRRIYRRPDLLQMKSEDRSRSILLGRLAEDDEVT